MKNFEKRKMQVAIKHLDRAVKALPDSAASKIVLTEARTICVKEYRGELEEYVNEHTEEPPAGDAA